MKATLFNPFKQAQRLAGGTGLGLFSLAKRTEALKGSYGVRNRQDEKQGSLFWFAIPYLPDESFASYEHTLMSTQQQKVTIATSSWMPPKDMKSNNNVMTFDLKDNSNKTESTTTMTIMKSSKSKSRSSSSLTMTSKIPFNRATSQMFILSSAEKFSLHILVVEDTLSIAKMLSMMLKRLGHQVICAENGEVALRKIEERWKSEHRGFDLVLMDLQMPVMDGLEATRRLRQMEREGRDWMSVKVSPSDGNHYPLPSSPHQLIIGASANSDEETMKAAYDCGFDDFIGKPFTMESLTRMILKHNIGDSEGKD